MTVNTGLELAFVGILDVVESIDLGVEDDQSVEYGVRHCQEMSIILQRLINDGMALISNF